MMLINMHEVTEQGKMSLYGLVFFYDYFSMIFLEYLLKLLGVVVSTPLFQRFAFIEVFFNYEISRLRSR